MDQDTQRRFWAKVEKTDACWNWIAARLPNGYGVMGVGGQNESAHRISYAIHVGPVPFGSRVFQTCRNRACVRPEHLGLKPSGGGRFWAKVRQSEGCWEWLGAKDPHGYGRYGLGARDEGIILAHRMAYQLAVGPIPAGKDVLHGCDNPSCVRPDHLHLGGHPDNMREMSERGRAPRGERQPHHKLTEDQVRQIKRRLANRQVVSVRAPEGGADRYSAIADELGVSEGTIRDIAKGRIWKHIT